MNPAAATNYATSLMVKAAGCGNNALVDVTVMATKFKPWPSQQKLHP